MRTDFAVLLGIVAFALVTMPFYARSAFRGRDELESGKRGSFVLGSFVREWFFWFVRPVERGSLALGLTPLFYNLTGVAFGILAGVLFATGSTVGAGWAVLLGGAADVLDGRIARATGVDSRRGAFLDSTMDRFAEVGALVGLAVFFRDSPVGVALAASALGGSLLVSYARARGESVDVLCTKGVLQRAERLLLVGFGGILDPTVAAWAGWTPGTLLLGVTAILAAGTVGTAVYRTVWIARRLPYLDEEES